MLITRVIKVTALARSNRVISLPVVVTGPECTTNLSVTETRRGKTVIASNYTPSTIYVMLKNPIYKGKVRHRDKIYDGEHVQPARVKAVAVV